MHPVRVLAVLFVFLLTSVIAAQNGATVEGTVRDATGAPVAGARVEVVVGGRPRSVGSDSVGHFRFEGLSAGTYRIVATHIGLAPASLDATLAEGATSVTLDLTLGDVVSTESVSVTGLAPGASLDTPTAAASRLGLTARETPATLNVMTFTEAQSRGLATTTEALARVPGVTAANLPSTFATSMRGFTAAAVSTLYDGTRSSTSSMVMRNFDSWTFDRIEVLKGPASVLYGEGALAGAINFVTKRPDFSQRRSEALVSVGSLGTARAGFGTTGPIGDGKRAAYRLDAVVAGGGGWVDDTESTALNVSGAVEIKLTAAATLSVSMDYFRDDYQTSYWGTPVVPAAVARDASHLLEDSRGFVIDRAMREVNFEATDGVNQTDALWLRGRLDWRLGGGWRLSNETFGYDALREWRNADTYGFDTARGLVTRSATAITHDHRFFGNRLTLGSDRRFGARRNRLTLGLETTRNTFHMPRRFGTSASVDPFEPQRGTFPAITAANFPGTGSFVDFDTTPSVLSGVAAGALSSTAPVTPPPGRVGVVVDLVDETQVFAQVTSAVAPVSTVPIISVANAQFDLPTGRSWEVGVKSTLAAGKVEFTGSVFDVMQDDILTRDPNNPNITVQGGRQSSRGVEMTVSVMPMPALRVDANGTLMRAQFDRLVEAGGANRTGNVPTNVPERLGGVWATYRFSGWPLTLGGGFRRQGRFFANNANTARLSGYTVVDAQASWRAGPGEIVVRGKNLTNALYADWGVTANQILLGRPRTIEAGYQFRF